MVEDNQVTYMFCKSFVKFFILIVGIFPFNQLESKINKIIGDVGNHVLTSPCMICGRDNKWAADANKYQCQNYQLNDSGKKNDLPDSLGVDYFEIAPEIS